MGGFRVCSSLRLTDSINGSAHRSEHNHSELHTGRAILTRKLHPRPPIFFRFRMAHSPPHGTVVFPLEVYRAMSFNAMNSDHARPYRGVITEEEIVSQLIAERRRSAGGRRDEGVGAALPPP